MGVFAGAESEVDVTGLEDGAVAAVAENALVVADGRAEGAGAVMVGLDWKTEPLCRSTRFIVGVFPEKNSAAVSEGSNDGAGGYISDWNESAWHAAVRSRR